MFRNLKFKIGLFAAALIVVFLVSAARAQTTSPLWGNLTAGKYPVGFKLLNLRDSARVFAEIDSAPGKILYAARPVSISVWYPAEIKSKDKKMPFAEYVYAYVSTDAELYNGLDEAARMRVVNFYRERNFKTAAKEKFDELLNTPTVVFKDASPATGKFPLVVYAPGAGGTPLTHAPICEFLASHGFVVMSAASRGMDSLGMTLDAAGVEAQTRDLEFILAAAAANFPNADRKSIGAVGFSLGSGAALSLAMRNPLVKAVASLDGSIGFAPYAAMHRQLADFAPANFRADLLYVDKIDYEYNDSSVFDALKYADRYHLGFRGIEHHDLIASKNISGLVKGTTDRNQAAVFRLSCEYLLNFLNSALKDDRESRAYLVAPSENLTKIKNFAELKRFSALPAPPTEAEFMRLFREPQGMQKAAEIFRQFKKQNPPARFWREAALENVGLDLLDENRAADALEIFKINHAEYPRSERALNNLADAYQSAGDPKTAQKIYRRILTINSRNKQALTGLKKLHRGAKK